MRSVCRLGFLLFLLAAGLSVRGVAGQEKGLTLDEAIRQALENGRTLEAARSDARAAEAVADQARAARLPAVDAQAGYTRLSDNIPSLDVELPPGFDAGNGSFTLSPVELDRFSSQIGITHVLFSGFRISKSIKAADHATKAAGFQAKQEEVDLAYQTRSAFWNLVRAQSSLEVIDKAREQMQEHLKDVRNRMEAGSATRAEELVVRTRLSDLGVDQVEAENAVLLARMELNRLVGRPLEEETSPRIPDSLPEPIDADPDALLAEVRSSHPGLLSLEQQKEALDARVGTARADWFPDVSLFGRYVYARPNQYFFLDQDQFKGSWEAGVTASWTLWDWNRRPAQVREAHARRDAAQSRLLDLEERIRVEAARQMLSVRSAARSMDAAELNVEDAEEGFRLMRGQYELGAALTSQVLEAETQLRRAQMRRENARADLAMAHAGLLRVMGRVR